MSMVHGSGGVPDAVSEPHGLPVRDVKTTPDLLPGDGLNDLR
jgi:hypothetical protein